MDAPRAPARDLVVIGTSAGGVEALPRVLGRLPPDFPAAICIVQHLLPTSMGLVEILQRSSPLPVAWAEHGDALVPGRVLVAPGGVHLLIEDGTVALVGGSRENHSRPSISRLFRSAAARRGNRTIAVLLTGMLDDGVSGLVAIQKAGGAVIVQDPTGAAFPDMPTAALRALEPDRVLPIDAIAAALVALGREAGPSVAVPDEVSREAALDEAGPHTPEAVAALGPQSPVACPECGGPLWETGDERSRGYRCYLGHAQSARTMLALKASEVERSLWSAVRALQERATTLGKLAQDSGRIGGGLAAAEYLKRQRESQEDADRARHFLLELQDHLTPE